MKREYYRSCVERLMASGMEAGEWCDLNGMARGTVYYWLKKFRDEEPDLLGGYEIAHAGDGERLWFNKVRAAYCAEHAIQLVPKADHPEKPASPGFMLLDLSGGAQPPAPAEASHADAGRPAITVSIGRAVVAVPAGSAAADISAVLEAVAKL